MPMRKREKIHTHTNALPDLLNVTQVCQKLGISRSKFYELIKITPLEVVEFEGVKRYDPYDLAVWIQKWKKVTPITKD